VFGYGFLRTNNYENSKDDIYVSAQNIKKFNLRRGDKIKATAKMVREGDSAALQEVLKINDLEPKLFLKRTNFDELLPYYPTDRIKLETDQNDNLSIRLIDLFCPLGMGQRGLIVAPPKTGKTTLLKYIAQSIEKNYSDVKLIMLLIDERPEEVTDIKRSVSGEVVFSTFDESPEHHIRAAELVINRAKRLVEVGQNVVILMDSITRLARAYNNTIESSGKIFALLISHSLRRLYHSNSCIEHGHRSLHPAADQKLIRRNTHTLPKQPDIVAWIIATDGTDLLNLYRLVQPIQHIQDAFFDFLSEIHEEN